MKSFRILLIPLFLLPACDGPGGGGGFVDCTLRPDLCAQPDVGGNDVTNGSGDTHAGGETNSPPDAGPGDSGQPFDTSAPPDTAPPIDTAPPVDTNPPPACDGFARRCAGNLVEMCSSGQWVTIDSCDEGTCVGGDCIAQPPSCEQGQRRCNGASVESCSGGQWSFVQSCPSGCNGGSCTTTQGGGDCNSILDCADASGCFGDSGTDVACFAVCLDGGSATGRNEANAMIGCFDNCEWDALCAYEVCSPQRAACFFAGTGGGDCTSIDSCTGGCSDQACVDRCYESATANAQSQYLWVIGCAGLYCDLSDTDCLSQVFSPGGPCEDAYASCFN